MASRLITLFAAASLSGGAYAQSFVETFEGGSNEGDYEIWFNVYNTIETSGGNPGAYLQLDNVTSGPSNCHFVETFPTTWPSAYSGDYRALGITSVGYDLNVIAQGAFGGEFRVILFSDPGTPSDSSDDCRVELIYDQPPLDPPSAPGWRSYDFPIDASSPTLPFNGDISGACAGMDSNVVWNNVIQDVDGVIFRYDTNPTAFCVFTSWILGVDNIRIDGVPTGIGTSYCSSVPTSSGSPALLSAFGSTSVAQQNLTLEATGLPANVNGIFYYGTLQTTLPFGDGFRCVSGMTQRLPFLAADAMGVLTEDDVFGLPMPNVPIAPGTLNFQAWFRDAPAGNTGFNLSDGVEITFVP